MYPTKNNPVINVTMKRIRGEYCASTLSAETVKCGLRYALRTRSRIITMMTMVNSVVPAQGQTLFLNPNTRASIAPIIPDKRRIIAGRFSPINKAVISLGRDIRNHKPIKI
jgi:hypothetical protein